MVFSVRSQISRRVDVNNINVLFSMVLTQKIAPKCSPEAVAASTASNATAVTSTTSTSSKSCRRKIAFHPTLGKKIVSILCLKIFMKFHPAMVSF